MLSETTSDYMLQKEFPQSYDTSASPETNLCVSALYLRRVLTQKVS